MSEEYSKLIITNSDFIDHIYALSDMIKRDQNERKTQYKAIYAIPRGGLIIGVYLSHLLDLDFCTDDKLIHPINRNYVLIVDDLVDTGRTLEAYPEFDHAVLYHKKRSSVHPKYVVKKNIDNNQWIVFPYERLSEEPNREL